MSFISEKKLFFNKAQTIKIIINQAAKIQIEENNKIKFIKMKKKQ